MANDLCDSRCASHKGHPCNCMMARNPGLGAGEIIQIVPHTHWAGLDQIIKDQNDYYGRCCSSPDIQEQPGEPPVDVCVSCGKEFR